MIILGIETSCDDTAVSVLQVKNGGFKILSDIVSSQVKTHRKYGGVYPFLAKREHQKNLEPTLKLALKKAGIKYSTPGVDLIAVTQGPGLEPCLWVGINFAKELAKKWNVPLVPVNHIESHILVNFLKNNRTMDSSMVPTFPAVALVVSGGHTQLILMEEIGKYKILGETRDDAAGECFDKCAKILGLGYPGGPAIAKLASEVALEVKLPTSKGSLTSNASVKLPRPMFNTKDYDFSFSGLKTAVLYNVIRKYGKIPLRSAFSGTAKGRQYIKKMCVEIQQAIIDVLLKKTIKAAKDYHAESIILGGGVSANEELRKQFIHSITTLQYYNINFLAPPKNLCVDNAVMTAITGYFHLKDKILPDVGRRVDLLEAKANLRLT